MFNFANFCPPVGRVSRRLPELQDAFSRLLRDRKGATAVETAAVLPVLLLILMGTIEFGRTMQAWNETGHALSKAVRVVNIDSNKTPDEVATLVRDYLAEVNTEALSVNAVTTTISGTDYMKISVSFPFDIIIPLWGVPTLTLEVDTLAPIISPLA